MKKALVSSLALLASTLAPACSLILDFTECTEDAHCSDDGELICVAERCEESGPVVSVSANVSSDTVWRAEKTYVLKDIIYVLPGARLTVEAGTTILGDQESALVVAPGGRLEALGTSERPVVFTSSKPEGMRAAGDWGGVSLLGYARVNTPSPLLEGLADAEFARFGGNDDDHNCGVIQYTRIEFAGRALEKDAELNGLTLAGCGSKTVIDYVQVHRGLDDGLELFGGTVDLRHVVITASADDGLDWQLGWTGSAQFVAIEQREGGDAGIEADNFEDDHDAAPRSSPRLYNVTILGVAGGQRGAVLRRGTGGVLSNLLIVGESTEAIDIRDAATVAALSSGGLAVRNSMFFGNGPGGAHHFPTLEDEPPGSEDDDDDGFDEAMFLVDPALANSVDLDPQLASVANATAPGWVPSASAAVRANADRPPAEHDGATFDDTADYVGAFNPDAANLWTSGWTAYPVN
ncbi:MAG: hypothetical protein KC636_16440 [Myxococcales bacterium]|nr:hypothetical protein [Myxococcales bacterium]